MADWYAQDEYWEVLEPVLFGADRVARAPEEVEQLVALLGLAPGAAVLDMPCGVGRHAIELGRRGFRVTGVDRTRAYLARARAAAAGAGVAVELVEDDLRTFVRPEAFDAAIVMWNSFTYFDDPADDRRMLENLRRSLRPGGVLLLGGVFTKETVARFYRVSPSRWWEEGGDIVVLQENTCVDDWSRMDNRWIVLRGGQRTELRFGQRLYSASELVALLHDCGFGSTATHRNLRGAPYDHRAEQLVVVARVRMVERAG